MCGTKNLDGLKGRMNKFLRKKKNPLMVTKDKELYSAWKTIELQTSESFKS